MPLTISLHTPSAIPLEVDAVVLETVRGQSADDVKRTLIQHGNRQVQVGEFFDVQGSAADDNMLVWQGDLAKVKRIGTKLTAGTIRVEGNAGMHLGAEMQGGEIVVEGNVADWCGAEMHGGRIHVRGNAGHLVGAVYRGGHKGMTGGEILIHGDAGDEVGHGIRRGLIAVAGSIGGFAGVGMIAGTIVVGSGGGNRHGAGMKRGTIAFLNPASGFEPLPTFRSSGPYQPTFLRLILRELQSAGFAVPAGAAHATYERWCGDLVELGKGELLVRQAA
ncbi:MAG: formylmethanofuran dehydrogenase subunit C [Planctomycetaceae bacterium]|nr:formylmethanofuran dehydrogenase subunit C [Planctomycetaceae bacterium]